MPEYTITIKVTKKAETEIVKAMTDEIAESLVYNLADDYGVNFLDIKDLKSMKPIMTAVRRAARTLTEQAFESAVKYMEESLGGDTLHETMHDRVYDWEALDGAEDYFEDLKAQFEAKKDFIELADSTKEQRFDEAKRTVLDLAEKIGATVTFPEDEE